MALDPFGSSQQPMVTLRLDEQQLADAEVADAFRTLMAALVGARERQHAKEMAKFSEFAKGHGYDIGPGDLGGGAIPFIPPPRRPKGG